MKNDFQSNFRRLISSKGESHLADRLWIALRIRLKRMCFKILFCPFFTPPTMPNVVKSSHTNYCQYLSFARIEQNIRNKMIYLIRSFIIIYFEGQIINKTYILTRIIITSMLNQMVNI